MKFKLIPKEYFITILDRLTRLEPAHLRYKRVFDDIINKFCIDTKAKNLSVDEEIKIVEDLFNFNFGSNSDMYLNGILMELEKKYFKFNDLSYQYLSARINIEALINEIKINDNIPKNVVWLKNVLENKTDIYKLRKKYSLTYPIEKIILCEGQTEFTLLNTIFKLFDVDINKLGFIPIAAGGKNQVARKYYQMIEYLKLPFFILLDKDAQSIKDIIQPKLREIDSLYLIKSGEFEDLISKKILQNTINTVHLCDFNCIFDDFNDDIPMVHNLENIYKKYGFGEFKKAKFALELKEFIENKCCKDDFVGSEIVEIINMLI